MNWLCVCVLYAICRIHREASMTYANNNDDNNMEVNPKKLKERPKKKKKKITGKGSLQGPASPLTSTCLCIYGSLTAIFRYSPLFYYDTCLDEVHDVDD